MDDALPRLWPPTDDRHTEAVQRVLRSRILVSGPETEAFEHEFAKYAGTRHAVFVSNGTVALTAILHGLGVGPGDEVIIPALTFSGTALPVVHVGARPVFADVDPRTFTMDPGSVRARISSRTAAIMPVHLHGLPADLNALGEIAEATGVPLVEDACQAPGASYHGRVVGSIGRAAGFSLNQTKPLWAGEGGVVTTDDEDLVRVIRRTRLFGEDVDTQPRTYLTTTVGFNWKATELQAALAREALRDLNQTNEQAVRYGQLLSDALDDGVLIAPAVPPGSTHTYHKYRALLTDPERDPDQVVELCQRNGVPACRWQVAPLSEHPAFAERADPCPVARDVLDHSVIIGTESQPLAAARDVVELWCDRLAAVQRDLAQPRRGVRARQ